ncbi:MAG: DUF3365 domain-containing protein [Planctomycetota bacterium]|nr:MAG: DUF3365 domain-containing protein [Planctomycetota bacterium]
MTKLPTFTSCLVIVMMIAALSLLKSPVAALAADKDAPAAPDAAAVERSRKTVQMLDQIYKQAIVLITDKYVHDEDDFPAGSAAVAWFDAISKTGSHQVRLIDASGEPYEPNNVARDEFERQGVKRLKAGDATYEQVVYDDGEPHLRVLTPVPVVMKKCVMCHPHYADAAPGEPIGAISYTMPIE